MNYSYGRAVVPEQGADIDDGDAVNSSLGA